MPEVLEARRDSELTGYSRLLKIRAEGDPSGIRSPCHGNLDRKPPGNRQPQSRLDLRQGEVSDRVASERCQEQRRLRCAVRLGQDGAEVLRSAGNAKPLKQGGMLHQVRANIRR